ncbi:hypothetical protein [Clostridium botulinum]|uniref:hypothetical protein n=1 Tax=Clostridium botulinum TaxID=1491 RepID=UPI00037F47CF|nr:hypothetical protein [Clostridium botulinum]KEH96738.1 hypothetical protein Z953_14040 [Clostridium botulinum D str. 16868]KLU74574.1 hypothetical protein CBC3_13650 [Clostridium botulinum V891]KOA73255.1 hypothetical protein ADU78_13010 [Clostridium botulinum]KOA91183.1 hypothetical protein ADU76_11805 [Clostridium botulinum]KOC32910.1 hypothetical protein ADU81_10495 [Clostridium botulinum]
MKSNKNLLCCLLSGFMLTLLAIPIRLEIIESVFDDNFFLRSKFYKLFNFLSFVGMLLVTIFSILLILNSLKLKNK